MPLLCSSLSSLPGAPLLWCRFWLPVPPMWNVLYHHSFNKYMHLLQCNAFDTFDMRTIEYLTICTVYFDTSDITYMYLPRLDGLPDGLPVLDGGGGGSLYDVFAAVPAMDSPFHFLGRYPLSSDFLGVVLVLAIFDIKRYKNINHQTAKDAVKRLFLVSRGFIMQYYARNPPIKRDNHFTASFTVWWFMF